MQKTGPAAELYLAGGCFWGMQKYFDAIEGVLRTEVGYANGRGENPTYEEVCRGDAGFAETVRVVYDPARAPLKFLAGLFFDAIDPTSVNRQGNDRGVQYRTGVYYTDAADLPALRACFEEAERRCGGPTAVELGPLENFYPAEEYHQKYLDKNPGGYCHIGPALIARAGASRPDGEGRATPVR